MRLKALYSAALIASMATSAHAGLIQIDFAGVIDIIEDNSNLLQGVTVGQEITGRMVYDDSPVGLTQPLPGWYYYPAEEPSLNWITSYITVGGQTFSLDRTISSLRDADNVLAVSMPQGHQVYLTDRLVGDLEQGPSGSATYRTQSMISLGGRNEIAESILLSDIAALAGTLTHFSYSKDSFVGLPTYHNVEIRGYLTSVTAAPLSDVPLPGAYILFASSFAVLGAVRRLKH